jgi:L-threonylcarbamoyladenylate synthase
VTELLRINPERPDLTAIARAADCLRGGGLVAFPTETVYGLGAHALDPAAVRRLFAAKGRPSNDPIIVHIAATDQLETVVAEIPEAAWRLGARFWPGPLTLVMKRAPAVPLEVTAGLDTVAVRVPAHPVARALLAATRLPIAAPSANSFSRPSPTLASHVMDDLGGQIDMVLDAGATPLGIESTVLDLTRARPTVLRPGAVTLEALRALIPLVHPGTGTAETAAEAAPSPGMLPKHYAPRAPLTLYQGPAAAVRSALLSSVRKAIAEGLRVGVLATSEQAASFRRLPVVVSELGPEASAESIAARLYAALRDLDTAQVDVIFAQELAGADGLWAALRDRLRRAATHLILVD